MLYFTVSYPTADGDVIKATYMLTTLPAWALTFGYATEWAIRRRLGAVLVAVLGGVSAGQPPLRGLRQPGRRTTVNRRPCLR